MGLELGRKGEWVAVPKFLRHLFDRVFQQQKAGLLQAASDPVGVGRDLHRGPEPAAEGRIGNAEASGKLRHVEPLVQVALQDGAGPTDQVAPHVAGFGPPRQVVKPVQEADYEGQGSSRRQVGLGPQHLAPEHSERLDYLLHPSH